MARAKQEKSTHLQELEEVFERRTRRFSPFDVLGLTQEDDGTSRRPTESIGESIGDQIGESIGTPIQSPIHTPIPTPIQSPIQTPDDSPNEKSLQSSNDTPHKLSTVSPHRSPNDSPNDSRERQRPPEAVLLTENQAILYFCLQHLGEAVTSLNRIAEATGISEHTLKSCLKKLTKEQIIHYGGRRNCGGRIGFTAQALDHRSIVLRGDERRLHHKLQRIDVSTLPFTTSLGHLAGPVARGSPQESSSAHPMDHRMEKSQNHPMDHRIESSCSSSKDLLLQELILEGAFKNLNPRSLIPYLEHFETTEELQNFLDMANACITAAKDGRGKPIKNPHGFLFAQLRQGYINPPEGYKSRRVRAQERRNQQLEAELAELRQLKAREQELRFELFKAQLTSEEEARLAREARVQVKPGLGISEERQLEVAKENILHAWFTQQDKT